MEFIAKCKAFATESPRKYRLYWDGSSLRVWDSVAGHYTTCHAISARAARRLVRLAAN